MADTIYGSRDRNSFNVPETFKVNGVDTKSNIKQDRKFYPLVDSVTGDITIKEYNGIPSSAGGNTSLDRTIGTIPKDNSFQPVQGQTTFDEIAYFNSTVGQKAVKNHAVITAQKAGAQNAQQLIFPNSATPGAGQGQSAPPTAPGETSETGEVSVNPLDEEEKKSLTEGIKTKGVRTSYDEDMRYPLNLNQNTVQNQDVINFTMYSYGTRSFGFPKFGDRKITKIPGSVTMAIQPRISDSNTVTWNDSSMDLVSMGMANASLNFIENGFDGASGTIDKAKGLVEGPEGTNLSAALKIYFAQQAASTQNLLSRLTGGILNPNLELLFENPDLRIFNYSFQLSPREPSEAIAIKKIIRFFKQGMAVQRSEAELFLKAPNVFEIKYLLSGGSTEHPYLNKIKRCALTNCSVDYTPTGSYMTFAGKENSMVSYNLSLTFKELEPIYADEYDNKDTEIGF